MQKKVLASLWRRVRHIIATNRHSRLENLRSSRLTVTIFRSCLLKNVISSIFDSQQREPIAVSSCQYSTSISTRCRWNWWRTRRIWSSCKPHGTDSERISSNPSRLQSSVGKLPELAISMRHSSEFHSSRVFSIFQQLFGSTKNPLNFTRQFIDRLSSSASLHWPDVPVFCGSDGPTMTLDNREFFLLAIACSAITCQMSFFLRRGLLRSGSLLQLDTFHYLNDDELHLHQRQACFVDGR